MATIGSNGVFRKEITCTAGNPNPFLVIPQHVKKVTLFYKAANGASTSKVQKSPSSADAIVAGTADWIDVATPTNTVYTDTDKKVMGDEVVSGVRLQRGSHDATLIVLGEVHPS